MQVLPAVMCVIRVVVGLVLVVGGLLPAIWLEAPFFVVEWIEKQSDEYPWLHQLLITCVLAALLGAVLMGLAMIVSAIFF